MGRAPGRLLINGLLLRLSSLLLDAGVMPLRIMQLLLLLEVPKVLLALIAQSRVLVLAHHLVLAKIGRHFATTLSILLLCLLGCVEVGRLLEWAAILASLLLRLHLLNYLLHV